MRKKSPLRNLRAARALNQDQMAVLLKVTQPTYSKYESGAIVPSADRQVLIATILGASVETLWPQLEQVAS